ncbi:MAG: hypothetical protein P8176_00490 [Gammaproteobacteria bacterium]
MTLTKQSSPVHRQALRSNEPFGAFSGLFDELLNSHLWPTPNNNGASVPRVDIIDRQDSYVIKAELPGVKKEETTASHMLVTSLKKV